MSPCRTDVLLVTAFRLMATRGGSPLDMDRSSATGGVRRVAASTIGEGSEQNVGESVPSVTSEWGSHEFLAYLPCFCLRWDGTNLLRH